MFTKKTVFGALFAVLLCAMAPLSAAEKDAPLEFRNAAQTSGDFTLSAAPADFLTDFAPREIVYTLENRSDETVSAAAVFSCADTVRPLSDDSAPTDKIERVIEVAPKSTASLAFRYAAFEGTYRALYPLRLRVTIPRAERTVALEAVRVIEVRDLPETGDDALRPTEIRKGVSLIGKSYRAWSDIEGKDRRPLGLNFRGGGDQDRRASIAVETVARGENRRAFNCHPPYLPKGGSLWLEFPLVLPVGERVTLFYGCAIRESSPTEPPSDGVTFRFWASEGADGGFDAKKPLDEFHTDAKTWQDRSLDLTPYAGKRITLWVELNPGPTNNTTCDGCSLSGLVVAADRPESLPPTERIAPVTFPLTDGFSAVVAPGENGLFDGTIALEAPDGKRLEYRGLSISVAGIDVNGERALAVERPSCSYDEAAKKIVCRALPLIDDEETPVTLEVYERGGMLIVAVPEGNPARIERLRLGGGSEELKRVYFGHGAAVEQLTGPLRVIGEGHRLSTRHIGADYANGISVLLAAETPPDYIAADPQSNLCTLEVSGVTRLAILPSQKGAFDAAIRFREASPWKETPSAGVARKAGRLVFDIWGGRFGENRAELEKAFLYGVTDSLVVKHDWQRWGYDVKLPDIWGADEQDAPMPALGTLDELRALAESCVSRQVPFALHDNYIDFYPDAEGFTYDDIAFTGAGTPVKAWINHGAQAQSYRWRPDRFLPFLERNMTLTKRFLPQTDAYFVDVFSSIQMFPFFDRQGVFHPLAETRAGWMKAFETIGERLAHKIGEKSETAITMSESGSDFLVGSLDGADCQWIALSKEGRPWSIPVPCDRWVRTPWYAAVHHTDFSRHGVGYESRYVGTLDPALHGTFSDDYLSMELLGGVDLMVPWGGVFPGAVRKHYLAQHIVRSRADAEILSVAFEPGENGEEDIFRQTVRWSDGTVVRANRGKTDWTLSDGTVLPQYGVSAVNENGMTAAILRNPANPAEVVEYARRADGSFYLNGRGTPRIAMNAVSPRLAESETLDGGKFRIAVEWEADSPLPKNLSTFVHIFEPYRGYGHTPKGWYAGGSTPSVPTDQWGTPEHREIRTDETVFTVPDDIPSGRYEIFVGLFDPKTHKRFPLIGRADNQTRYSIAALKIDRQGENVRLTLEQTTLDEPRELFLRLIGNRTPAVFGGVETLGAVYVEPSENGWSILPLPQKEPFDVTVDEKAVGKKIVKITAAGAEVPFSRVGDRVTFRVTAKDAVRYALSFE